MTKQDKISIIKTTAVLTVICVIITGAMAVTNMFTKDKIASLARQNQIAAMERIIEAKKYEFSTVEIDGEKVEYTIAKNNDLPIGFIFTQTAKGYGGDVAVITGVGVDGSVIAVEVTDAANETPGLGQNVTKPAFYDQFRGLKEGIEVVKNGAGDNQVQAVTGATISSNAVTKAVNDSLELFKEINGGAENE